MFWLIESILALLVDVSVKSLFLALLAASALAVFRVRNTNVRHRVWTAILLGMLALPLLVPITPTVPMPSYLTPEFSVRHTAWNDSNQSTTSAVNFDETTAHSKVPNNDGDGHMPAAEVRADLGTPAEITARAIFTSGTTKSKSSYWTNAVAVMRVHWRGLIGIAYLLIAGGYLTRISLGLWWSHRIVTRSEGLELQQRYRPATVRVSDELRVPLSVGFLRPKILLPTEWDQWTSAKFSTVLAHESAHVRRNDYLVTLLAEFNRAIYWFHPLAWLLRKKLAELAEQSCDDEVILLTGERTQYARHLLEVAGSLRENRGRLAWSGVAMARKPNVESRIDAILDAQRPLARRIGWAGALLLVATAVPAVLLAAAIRPAEQVSADDSAVEVTETPGDHSASVPTSEFHPDSRPSPTIPQQRETVTAFKGQVLAPDGNGKAGANVYVVSTRLNHLMHPVRETVLARATADAEGRFDFPVRLPLRDEQLDNSPGYSHFEQIIATADGLGAATSDVIGIRDGQEVTLQLPTPQLIQGQILNLEGQPLAGANLRVLSASVPYEGIEKTLARLRELALTKPGYYSTFAVMSDWSASTTVDRYHNERRITQELRYPSVGLPQQVKTDAEGRFSIDGVGKDRMVALELTGPNIVTTWLSVVSRDMEPINRAFYGGCRTNVTYGAKLNYSAEPSQPIEGTLTDAVTGQPLANFQVETGRHESGYAITKTDAQGKFRLSGAPRRKTHRLEITPPDDQPYFRRGVASDEAAAGLAPVVIDAQLKPTQWIQGRVTDKATGKPVAARVVYVPHVENKLAGEYPALVRLQGAFIHPLEREIGSTHLGQTAQDGSYRLPAIPGEGLVVVMATDAKYRVGVGKDELPADWLERRDGLELVKTLGLIDPQWMHAIRYVNVPENDVTTIDLQVEPGQSLVVKLKDNDGQPLSGVIVKGQHALSFGMDAASEVDQVTISGISQSNPRSVLFYHREQNLGAYLLADGRHQDVVDIRLQPCATLKGRLVDAEGKAQANRFVALRTVKPLSESYVPIGQTDELGRFETTNFMPNVNFKLITFGRREVTLKDQIALKPGATLDLRDIEPDSETIAVGVSEVE